MEDTQKVFSNGRTTKTFRTTKNKPLKEKVMKNENYKPLSSRGGGEGALKEQVFLTVQVY